MDSKAAAQFLHYIPSCIFSSDETVHQNTRSICCSHFQPTVWRQQSEDSPESCSKGWSARSQGGNKDNLSKQNQKKKELPTAEQGLNNQVNELQA